MIDSPLKWHGGKHYLAPKLWEIAKTIPHIHRVEVFGGSLAFTLATDPEGFSEVVNDTNFPLMNFWGVLRSDGAFEDFSRKAQCLPFSEDLWEAAEDVLYEGNTVERALAFFVFCRQSMAGRMKNFAPLSKNRVRRGMNEQASAWINCVDGLPEVHSRLRRVVVRNKPSLDLIRSEDSSNTLFYLDPPYVHSTRATTSEYGAHEMSEADHGALLNLIAGIDGKFLLSGYRSELYDDNASDFGWERIDFDLPNNSSSAKTKERKTECAWVKR